MAKKRRIKGKGGGKFEALKYVKQLEKKMGPKEEKTRKEEDKVKGEEQKVLDLIKEAENELMSLREKVNIQKLDTLLQAANDALSDGDPKRAQEIAVKLKEEINKVVENHIEKRFFDAEMLIIELEVVGIDVTSSKKVVEQGKKALRSKKLKEALEHAEKASSEVEKLQRQQVTEVMTYAKSIMDSLKSFQVDTSSFNTRLEEAESALDKKNFDSAMEIVIGLEGELSNFRVAQFDKMVAQTNQIIKGKEEEGKDVSEAERMMKRALKSIDIKDFESASDYLVEARYAADKEAGLEFKSKAGCKKARERYEELKKEGINSSVGGEHLRKAEKALKKRDFNSALMESKKADGAMMTAIREHDRITQHIGRVIKNSKLAEKLGCDLEETKALLDQANLELGEGEFDLAFDFTNQADEEIDRAIDTKVKAERVEMLEIAVSVKDSRAQRQLDDAVNFVKKGKIEKGFALVNKVKNRLSGAKAKITNLREGIENLQESIEDLALKGMDISEAMDLIENVQEAMSNGNFARARSEFYHAERIVSQWMADMVYVNLSKIEDDMAGLERLGLYPKTLGDKLDDSWAHFVKNEKDKASESSRNLHTDLTKYIEAYSTTMESIQQAQSQVHNAALMGVDVSGPQGELSQAFDSVQAIDFPNGRTFAQQAIEDVGALVRSTVTNLRDSTKTKMEDMESNFPVPMARDRYKRAKSMMDLGAYYNAFIEFDEATTFIDGLFNKLENLDNDFDNIETLLVQGKSLDVDVSSFKDLLAEAVSNKESGHLEMSISLLDQIKEDVEEIFDIRIKERKEQISTILSDCEECSIDVEDARRKMAEADALVTSQNYADAFNTLSEAHTELVSMKQQYDEAKDAVDLLEANIQRSESLGLDTTVAKKSLAEAMMNLSTGQFSISLDMAIEAGADMDSRVDGMVEEKISKDLDEWIQKAKRFEADISEAEGFKEMAQAEIESHDYEEAIEHINHGVDQARSSIIAVLQGRIDEVSKDVANAHDNGIAPGKASRMIETANKMLASGDFHKVAEILSNTDEILAEQIGKHEDAMKALMGCGKLIVDYSELGVNLEVAKDSLSTARNSMSSGEYDIAMDLINQACDIAENQKSGYEKAKMAIEDTLTLIEELTDMDIDTIALTEETTRVYDLIEQGAYSEALTMSFDLKERAEELRIEHFTKRMEDLKTVVDEEERNKEDVSNIQKIIEEIDNAFSAHEYKEINSKIDKGHEMVAALKERFINESEKVEETEKDLESFEEREIIINQARKILAKAHSELDSRRYDGLDGLLQDSLIAAARAEEEKEEATTALAACLEAIDIPFEDMDLEHLASLSAEAHDKYDLGAYDEAKVLAHNTLEESKRLQSEFVSAKLADCISMKEQIEAEGVNTSTLSDNFGEATRLLHESDFVDAYQLCNDVMKDMDRLNSEYSEARASLVNLDEMIAELKSIGVSVEVAEQLSSDVNEAFTIPDYLAGRDLAEQGIEGLVSERETHFTTLVAEIEGMISQAKEDGIPIDRPEELFIEGNALLDNSQYLEAHARLSEAIESLGSNRESYSDLSERLKKIMASTEEAKGYGVATSTVSEAISGAKDALIEARFDDTRSKIEDATAILDREWNSTATSRIEECRTEITRLEEKGLPIDDIMDIFNGADAALEIKEFIEVFTICSTTMEMVEQGMTVLERVKDIVSSARTTMESVKDIPIDMNADWERLHGVEHALKEGRMEEAEEGARSLLEDIDTSMNDFFANRLEKVQEDVDEVLQSGVRFTQVDFASEVLNRIAEKDYGHAWQVLEEGSSELDQVSKDYKEARVALERATNLVYEAEEEIDLASATEFIEQANTNLENGDYAKTKELSDQAISELQRCTTHYLEGKLASTDLYLHNLDLGGKVVLTKATKLLDEARGTLQEKDLEGTKVNIKQCIKEAKRARINFEMAGEVIRALEEIFTAPIINLHILKEGREKAKAAFEKDWEKFIEVGDVGRANGPIAAQLILRYQVKFEESVTIDIDVTKGQGLLDQAKEALVGHDYIEAVRLAMECYDNVSKSEKIATMRTLISMEEILDELKDMGIDCSIQENLLNTAREAIDQKNTSKAFKYMHECNESLLGLKEEHTLTNEALKHAEVALFVADHLGVDTSLAMDLLSSAETMLKENDFESAKDMSRQSINEIHKAKGDMVASKQSAVQGLIEVAEKDGVPVHRAKNLIKKSSELLDVEDFLRAQSLAHEAEEHARHMSKVHGDIRELVEATNEKIEYAKGLGLDMSAIQTLQNRMNAVIATGKHDKVKELSTEIEGELLTKIVALCNQSIAEVSQKNRSCDTMGIDVEDLRAELRDAENALDDEDFDMVLEKTNDLKARIDTRVAEEVTSKLEGLRSIINDPATAGTLVSATARLFETAEDLVTKGEYAEAFETMGQVQNDLRTEKMKHLKSILKSTQKLVGAAEKQKLDVYAARGNLAEAIDALDRMDVEEAYDFAQLAFNDAKQINTKYIEDNLAVAKAVIEMARETGGDTKRVDNFISKTEELVANDKFERAMFYAKQCSREVDRLQFKLIQSMIMKLEARIKSDPEKDYTKAKDLLEKAKSALLTKRYDLARNTILECRGEMNNIQQVQSKPVPEIEEEKTPETDQGTIPEEEPLEGDETTPEGEAEVGQVEASEDPTSLDKLRLEAKDTMDSTFSMIDQLRGEEVDVTDLESGFQVALTAFNNGDFVAAMDEAETVLTLATNMRNAIMGDPTVTQKTSPEEEVVEALAPASEPEGPGEATPASEHSLKLEGLFKSVQDNIDDVAKLGLQVKTFNDDVQRAREVLGQGQVTAAEDILKAVDGQMTSMLAILKEVDEIVTEVDKLLTMAANYSFDIYQAQIKYQEGLSARSSDIELARKNFEEARTMVLALLEGVYPYICVDMVKEKPFVSGVWNDTFIYISNTGNIYARDLKMELQGAAMEEEVILPRVDIGETKEIPVKVMPGGQGEQTLIIRISFERNFDSRTYVAEFPQSIMVNVPQRGPMG